MSRHAQPQPQAQHQPRKTVPSLKQSRGKLEKRLDVTLTVLMIVMQIVSLSIFYPNKISYAIYSNRPVANVTFWFDSATYASLWMYEGN